MLKAATRSWPSSHACTIAGSSATIAAAYGSRSRSLGLSVRAAMSYPSSVFRWQTISHEACHAVRFGCHLAPATISSTRDPE